MKQPGLQTLIIILFLIGYAQFACADDKTEIQAFMARGDYQAALTKTDEALKINTLDESLLLLRGFLLLKLDRLDEATVYYQKLREVLKHNPEPGNNLGMAYRQQKKYLAAIRAFDETIRSFPNYTPAHINLGDTHIEIAKLRYQHGFETTGNVMLQQKAALANNFERLAGQTMENNARQIAELGNLLPAVESKPEPGLNSRPAADPTQEIVTVLESWADAWMSRDPDRFFWHYAENFVPENSFSLAVWMQRRRDVFSKSEYIKLHLSDIDIQFDSENQDIVTVTFKQRYISDSYGEDTRKKMVMRKNEHGWLIVNEWNIRD